MVKASELRPHPQNWRRHPSFQQSVMREVLAEIGFAGAVLARETPDGLQIIDGHLRAEVSGDTQVPVLVLDVDEAEAKKLLLTFDPLGAMAEANNEVLTELLAQVDFGGKAINEMLSGMLQDVPKVGLVDDDEIPEQVETICKTGDLWQLGNHRLLCGDSTNEFPHILGTDSINLVLTDPPYGINIVKGLGSANGAKPFGRVRQEGGKAKGVLGTTGSLKYLGKSLRQGLVGGPGVVKPRLYYPVVGDDKPFDPQWLLNIGEQQIIWGANYFASKLRDKTSWIIWDKGISPESTFSACELAWTSLEGHLRLYRQRWSGMIRSGSRKEELKDRVHPTQKPVGLLSQILQDFSKIGDLIFDPYCGSGSTLIACEKLNRRCYMMEIDEYYCDVIIQRWQTFTGQEAELCPR